MQLLIVKTSSMGDVVHALPAVSDLLTNCPGASVDWLVEAPFAAIPQMHGGVRRVLPMEAPAVHPDRPYVLVTPGGGGDGEALVDWTLRAYESDPTLEPAALIVYGPVADDATVPHQHAAAFILEYDSHQHVRGSFILDQSGRESRRWGAYLHWGQPTCVYRKAVFDGPPVQSFADLEQCSDEQHDRRIAGAGADEFHGLGGECGRT